MGKGFQVEEGQFPSSAQGEQGCGTAEWVAMRGGGRGGVLRDRAVGFLLRALGSLRGSMAGVEALKVSMVRPATSMPSSLMAPPWEAASLEHQAPLVTQGFPTSFLATLLPGYSFPG